MQGQSPEEEQLLQGKYTASDKPIPLHGGVDETDIGSGMPRRLKTGLEMMSGLDLSSIRVHTNSSKPARFHSLAHTQGKDIYVGPGQEKQLSHEGWHAVQQLQGRVKPVAQDNGVPINDDADLEREAEVMGTQALQIKPADHAAMSSAHRNGPYFQTSHQIPAASNPKPVVQRQVDTWGGRWSTSMYKLVDENYPIFNGQVDPSRGLRGVSIQLIFEPGDHVNAERIGLTQSSQAFVDKQASWAFGDSTNKARSIQSTDAIPIDTGRNETDEATHIDKAPQYNNPVYPVQSASSESLEDSNILPKKMGRTWLSF